MVTSPKKEKTPTPKKVEKETSMKAPKKAVLSVEVFDLSGKSISTIALPKTLFDIPVSTKLLAQYVRVYMTNNRQGTVSTKTRSEIVLSKRKMYKQKGTGRARHGTRAAHIFVGGGVAFGPKPRDFALKLSKNQKQKALFGALTLAHREGKIMGLSDSALSTKPKTSIVAGFIKSRELGGKKTLLVLPAAKAHPTLELAARNLVDIAVIPAQSINAYSILQADAVVIVESAVDTLQKHFVKTS